MTRFIAGTLLIAVMIPGTKLAFSQDFPNKPIRIFTGQPGGSVNFITRLIAEAIAEPLGQQVIVENRPTVLGLSTVAKSPPDGYTLSLGSGSIWIGPVLQKLPYDAVRDFAPVSIVARQPNVLMVHPSLPVKSVKDLIALARARPGALNYTSGSTGSASHLASILFKSLAKVDIQYVPEGSVQGNVMLMSGEIEMMFGALGAASGNIKAGKVRALAVTTAERSQLAPEFPTMVESGLPGATFEATNAVFAPARTPPAIIQRLNHEIVRAVTSPKVKQLMLNSSIEPAGTSAEALAAAVKGDIATVNKMIKDGHIKTEN